MIIKLVYYKYIFFGFSVNREADCRKLPLVVKNSMLSCGMLKYLQEDKAVNIIYYDVSKNDTLNTY